MIVQDNPNSNTAEGRRAPGSLIIKPKKLVFYTIFVFAFLLSGALVMLDVVPYRMNPVSLLVIPLFFLYGVRFDRVVIAFGLLTLVILLSAVINQVSITQLILFLRGVLFAFLIYSLVRLTVNSKNIATIIRVCIVVGMIQLPIMLLQFMTYDYTGNDSLPHRLQLRDISHQRRCSNDFLSDIARYLPAV